MAWAGHGSCNFWEVYTVCGLQFLGRSVHVSIPKFPRPPRRNFQNRPNLHGVRVFWRAPDSRSSLPSLFVTRRRFTMRRRVTNKEGSDEPRVGFSQDRSAYNATRSEEEHGPRRRSRRGAASLSAAQHQRQGTTPRTGWLGGGGAPIPFLRRRGTSKSLGGTTRRRTTCYGWVVGWDGLLIGVQ